MTVENKNKINDARRLIDDFSHRTGLIGDEGDLKNRYLWTDAFAVQTLFALAHALEDERFKMRALKLIDAVHETLGKFHPDDRRNGWISGFSDEEGRKHPTAGGLRIGKKLPERKKDEPLNERLEWERDGQYFHYITRWINALLQAGLETGESKYALWAAELLKASEKFIDKSGGRFRMYWKMSIDLSRPLISNMGAHDPLEGLMCAESVLQAVPEKEPELSNFIYDMERLSEGRDWTTSDDLGIGGLLLNAVRAVRLAEVKELSEAIKPEKLMADSLEGLKMYIRGYDKNRPSEKRLAFRECGLALGLRALSGLLKRPEAVVNLYNQLFEFIPLADEIEDFWNFSFNRTASTWIDHLEINEVSLASSMAAKYYPHAFICLKNEYDKK